MPFDVIMVAVSFFLSLFLVALVMGLSKRRSWFDRIDERKIHTGDVPRLGGVGFSLAFIMVAPVISFHQISGGNFGPRFLPVIAAMLLVLAVGVMDDFRPLPPWLKLAIQIFAALLVVIPGYTFRRLFFFDVAGFGPLPWWLSHPLTLLWIVGITNALNFIDGVDGLCGGLSVCIALTYGFIFSSFSDDSAVPTFCFCLAAVLSGFLVFNLPLPRARIFMGDGGALFLGFVLAVLPLMSRIPENPSLPLPYAAALLLIPILDVIAAVWRRARDGHPIDRPDQSHVHHKLMNLGRGAGGIDGLLWLLQILLGFLVYRSIRAPGYGSLPLLGAAYSIAVAFFVAVHFLNRRKNLAAARPEPASSAGDETGRS